MTQNIGSIKTLKKLSPKAFITFVVMFFGGFINFFIWGIRGVASFEVGFVCFMLVFLSLFLSMKSRLKNSQEEFNFSQKFSLGLGVSFSLFRLLSYGVLLLALIVLIEFDYFALYSYMIGIFASLLCSFYRFY